MQNIKSLNNDFNLSHGLELIITILAIFNDKYSCTNYFLVLKPKDFQILRIKIMTVLMGIGFK